MEDIRENDERGNYLANQQEVRRRVENI